MKRAAAVLIVFCFLFTPLYYSHELYVESDEIQEEEEEQESEVLAVLNWNVYDRT